MDYSNDQSQPAQPQTPFSGDETGEIFALPEDELNAKAETQARSFETQSGYLVLVKNLGNRLALSFKRQIGTPPTSSIFLTPDEAQRLANVLGSNERRKSLNNQVISAIRATQQEQKLERLNRSRRGAKSVITILTVLFLISVVLCAVLAILVYQTQISVSVKP